MPEDQNTNNLEPVLDHLLLQSKQSGDETNALLSHQLEQASHTEKILENTLESNVRILDELKKNNAKEDPEVQKVEIMGIEVVTLQGKPGKDGRTLTDEELVTLIKPLIPEAKEGRTPTSEEILAIMRPLIPVVKDGETPSDERLLALMEPLMPKDGEDGEDGISPDPQLVAIEASKIATENLKTLIPKEETLEELKIKVESVGISYEKLKDTPNIEAYVSRIKQASRDYELSELKDVKVNSPTNAQALVYNSTTHTWENQNQSSGGGVTKIVAGNNITISPVNGLGDITINAASGGTPSGSPTELQFNDSGTFNGISGSSVDNTDKFVGFNQATPLAHVHAGTTATTLAAPTSGTATISAFGLPGFTLGAGNKTYDVYSKRNSPLLFSSALQIDFTEPDPTTYDVSNVVASFNPGGTGYFSNGSNFVFNIYAVYSGQTSLHAVASNTITDNNDSTPYSIDLNWTVPSIGVPDNYLMVRQINGGSQDYQLVGSSATSFPDNNSGWGGSPSYSVLTYQINLAYTASVSSIDTYQLVNLNDVKYILDSNVAVVDDNSWSGGVPIPSPTTTYSESLISEGDTELIKTGGNISFFGGTKVPRQSGDIRTALGPTAYNLITSPTLNVDLATDVTNTLPIGNGGTGNNSYHADQIFFGSFQQNAGLTWNGNLNLSLGANLNLGNGSFISFGQSSGSNIGTSITDKFGFWNVTPIIQPVNTVAIDSVLTNTGLRASGGISNFATTIKPRTGSASAGTAPYQDTSGTLLTTPVVGAKEFLNDKWYGTITTSTARKEFTLNDSALTSGKIPTSTTNGRLQDSNISDGANGTVLAKSLSLPYVAKTTTYTATLSDYFINCTSGTFTVTLPTAVGFAGLGYCVKNTGTGVITIGTTSAQTVDGASTQSLSTQYAALTVFSNGANWLIQA